MSTLTRNDLQELIVDGAHADVGFESAEAQPERLAGQMAGLLNMQGGYILLGVDDDGTVSGLTGDPKDAEERAMCAARSFLQPSEIPRWTVVDWEPGIKVGVIELDADAASKPRKARQDEAWVTKRRVGTVTRDATRAEERALYNECGTLWFGRKPLFRASLGDLDLKRLNDYVELTAGDTAVPTSGSSEWRRLLNELNLAVTRRDRIVPTLSAMLLFGATPSRFLSQAGINALCYESDERDTPIVANELLEGPFVPLLNNNGELVGPGLVDQACDFVHRSTALLSESRTGVRSEQQYPNIAVREAVVNALVHRDYATSHSKVGVSVYGDRVEVTSPGSLPDYVTIKRLETGARYIRDFTLMNAMWRYSYAEDRGMGVRDKMIPAMWEHNRTSPEFIETDVSFTVRLWK